MKSQDKIHKLKQVIELLQNDTITPKEVERFLATVVQVIKDQKDQFQTISNKNLAEIDEAVKYLSNNYKEQLANIEKKATQDFNKEVKAVESKIKDVKKLVDEAIKMKPKDGEKGDDGYTPVLGKDYFTDKDKEVFKKDVVKELDLEKVIDSKIKDFPKMEDFDNLNLKLNEFSSRKIPIGLEVFKDGKNLGRFPSINFKGGDIQASASRIDVDLSKSIEWGEIGGTLTDQTDLTTYVTGLPVSTFTNDAGYITSYTETQTLQDVTDLGATTTNAITVNGLTSNSTVNINNAADLNLSATANSNGRITGIGRAEFVNNGFFGVSGTSYISFNTSVGSIFSQPIRVNDDINLAFGNARDYTIGHHSASDTLQIVDGSTLNSNVRMQLDSSGNFVFGGTTASARLHAISTTEQLRLGYDASNYASFTVNSTGNLTIETPSNGITLVSNSTSTAGGIVFQREPDLATNNRYSVMNTVQAATTNSPSANASFTAIDFTPRYSGTGTLKTLYGAFFSPLNSGTGTVTNLTGSAYWVRNTSTGTVTTMKGVEVLAPINSGTIGGSVYGAFINNQGLSGVTNSYGLFVSAQSGSTNNYAIKTGTGLVDFGDDTNIAGTLTVTDTTEQARFGYDASNYASFTVSSAGNLTIEPTGNQVLFPAGSASTPGISFTGESDTGLYQVGTDQIGITTGGIARFFINTTTFRSSGVGGISINNTASQSATNPGYSIRGDENTGMYSDTADTLQFATGGALRATLNNTGLGVGGAPVASAILQADSTTQGFLPPRMTTTEKNAISSPATGLVVFDTTLAKLCVYTGAGWETVISA